MYFTTAWSKVFAVDAAHGGAAVAYDPEVPREWGAQRLLRRGQSRRGGVGREGLFVGTLDGRLVALDAATGKVLWES